MMNGITNPTKANYKKTSTSILDKMFRKFDLTYNFETVMDKLEKKQAQREKVVVR